MILKRKVNLIEQLVLSINGGNLLRVLLLVSSDFNLVIFPRKKQNKADPNRRSQKNENEVSNSFSEVIYNYEKKQKDIQF